MQRVRLAQVDSSWFSYPPGFESALSSADGIVRADSTVELLRSERDLCENLVVMGCAPALSILVEHVARSDEPAGILWSNASSTTALQCLAGGRTHLAGAHHHARRTASRNFADVKRITRGIPTTLITLAWWEVGLVVPKGNPLRLRRASDLARKTLRVALREEGSGARRLLDRQLGEAGVVLGPGPHLALDGHLEVARAVAAGTADVGVATQDAALSHHLTFIPLDEERYDLVIPTTRMTDPRVVRMLDTLATSSFRRDIASLGYRTSATGERAAS